jgi:hypothetical protein
VPSRHRIARTQVSVVLLFLQLVATALHVVPSLVYASYGHPTTRIVAYISSLGPLWVLLFGATSVGMLVALRTGKGAYLAHVACGGVWVFYTIALWFGALASSPHGTVLFPVVTTALVFVHTILAGSYSDDAGVDRRRA